MCESTVSPLPNSLASQTLATDPILYSVLLSSILVASSIGQMSAPLTAAYQAAEAVGIFHTIIDFPKPVYGTLTSDDPLSGDIVLENVNFAYPARPEVKVLDSLNMSFPKGQITAIVGPSGSGKSTIVSIIERWYEFNGDPVTNPFVSSNSTITFFVPNGPTWPIYEASVPFLTFPRSCGAGTDQLQPRVRSSRISTQSGGVARSALSNRTTSFSMLPSTVMLSMASSGLRGNTQTRK